MVSDAGRFMQAHGENKEGKMKKTAFFGLCSGVFWGNVRKLF
jgi:hypothetical protein